MIMYNVELKLYYSYYKLHWWNGFITLKNVVLQVFTDIQVGFWKRIIAVHDDIDLKYFIKSFCCNR